MSATKESQRVWQEVAALYPVDSEAVWGLAEMAPKERSAHWAGCHPRASEPTQGWDSIRSL